MLESKFLELTNKDPHWERRESPVEQYLLLLQDLGIKYKGKKLLDVGCARGIEVGKFRERGILADGIDVEEKSIRVAKERNPEANFVVANAEELPYQEEAYDLIFSINTLFFTNIEKSIPEYCRILKKGGYGIISFDSHIENLYENTPMHSDSLEHIKQVLDDAGAEILMIGDEEKRVDTQQKNADGTKVPKHEHTFHKIIFKKSLN